MRILAWHPILINVDIDRHVYSIVYCDDDNQKGRCTICKLVNVNYLGTNCLSVHKDCIICISPINIYPDTWGYDALATLKWIIIRQREHNENMSAFVRNMS